MQKLPKRSADLIEQDVGGELVVYDPVRGQAHFLNDPAALVFRNCDGRRTVGAVARKLAGEGPLGASEDAVRMALDQLTQNGLVADRSDREAGPSRRDFVRRWGKAAVAIPAIMSVVAALPASAASHCVVNGSSGGCTGANVGDPCTTSAVADGQCTTSFCGALFDSAGTACNSGDNFGGFACFVNNGTNQQPSCAAARAAAAGGLYACSICP